MLLCIKVMVLFKYNDKEFNKIIEDILNIKEFNKLKNKKHHGITRFDHSMRVSYRTYQITKKLKLNYIEATRAALLHDFFNDEVKNKNGLIRLIEHPNFALINASKYFNLSKMQVDIIKKHMFPVTLKPPVYKESIIVSFIDKTSSIYERFLWIRNKIK